MASFATGGGAAAAAHAALRRGSVVAQVEDSQCGTLYTVNKTSAAMTPLHVINRLERVFDEDEDPLLKMSQGPNNGVKWRIVRLGQGNELVGALCPWNEMTTLRYIGGGKNTTALQQLPLFLHGKQVVFDPRLDAIHVATDQSIKAMFDGRTTNSEQFRVWDLPAPRPQTDQRQWTPSQTKFDGRTTNAAAYKAHDYVPQRSSRPPQVAAVSDAPFDGRTTNSDQYKQWDLPERRQTSPARQWTPSQTKFDGTTTNASQFKAYAVQEQLPVRVVIDTRTIAKT